jgi:hypothetical protein
MSQKELLYYEDAIMHEDYTIKICKDLASRLKDAELISFMNNEIKHHQMIRNKLLTQMEESSHE